VSGPVRRRVLTLGADRCSDRVARACEDVEERVALRVDLDAVARSERVADDAPVSAENIRVCVAEPLQVLGRGLDIGEHERHGSGRELRPATIVRPEPAQMPMRSASRRATGHAPSLQFETTVTVVSVLGAWSERKETPASYPSSATVPGDDCNQKPSP